MRGFNFVDLMRSMLIATVAHILAPCPHALTCPMAVIGDWCHFATRVQRTSLHRQIKGGTLGHEDEKFSYVVASRQGFPRPQARIVRHPQKHAGHIQLAPCAPEGLKKVTITKSQKDEYRRAAILSGEESGKVANPKRRHFEVCLGGAQAGGETLRLVISCSLQIVEARPLITLKPGEQ